MKKRGFLTIALTLIITSCILGQDAKSKKAEQDVIALIDKYSLARENKDTVLLKRILTTDVDQLVSTGEWRNGIKESVSGMLRSSAVSPGTRKLIVERVRFFNPETGIADARYEIQNPDGTLRKMWSTFVVIYAERTWKITAIRNMLPTAQP